MRYLPPRYACLLAFLGSGLLAPVLSGAAAADQSDEVGAKIRSAMNNAKTFVMQLSIPDHLSGQIVVVLPDRSSSVAKVDGITAPGQSSTVEIVADGGTEYVRLNGGAWHAGTLDEASRTVSPLLNPAQHITLLADRTDNGVTAGAFSYEQVSKKLDVSSPAFTTVCTYDKKTFLPKKCTTSAANSPAMVITYGKWHDPGNVVLIPTNVASPSAAVPAAAPAASGSAAPSGDASAAPAAPASAMPAAPAASASPAAHT